MKTPKLLFAISTATAILLSGCGSSSSSSSPQTPVQPNTSVTGLHGVNNIVVIYLENRSYDSMFANFPNANGALTNDYVFDQFQYDENGTQYNNLPMPVGTNQSLSSSNAWANYMRKYPWINNQGVDSGLANAPFSMDAYITNLYATSQNANLEPSNSALWYMIPDVKHRFFPNQYQISGINGKPNSLYAYLNSVNNDYSKYQWDGSQSMGISMGHNDTSGTSMWSYAQNFAMLDNFYASAFGGSFLNHQYLIAAQAPTVSALPSGTTNTLSSYTGKSFAPCSDTVYTRIPCTATDGTIYAVNTVQPLNPPFDPTTQPANRLPVQTNTTIGDRLSDKNIAWKWYSGGYNEAMAGNGPAINYQYHHNPFAYYQNYLPGTSGRAHIADDTQLFADIASGNLPQVSFWKPAADVNGHPGYSSIAAMDTAVANVVSRIQNSTYWNNTVIIITFDEYGGLWDHTTPFQRDAFGPGTRIPAIIISPLVKKGYVDNTQYDTTSILAFIETIFGLASLTEVDGNKTLNKQNLFNAFGW